jgi:UDP-3-O-[3-hydroxymyristoyl] glucosamine N-acyltransferase
MTVAELIEKLGGELVAGDTSAVVTRVADLESAGEDTLVFGQDGASAERAVRSAAGAAVVPAGFGRDDRLAVADAGRMAVVAAKQPRLWFAKAAKLLALAAAGEGAVHSLAVVAADVWLAEGVSVGPWSVIGARAAVGPGTRIEAGTVIGEDVVIGAGCRIYPRVTVYAGTRIGDRVVVHAGAVLGADGFGYVRDGETGAYTQFPQQGRLVIEDDVEIGANTTIDRGALAETRIRRGVKLDNLVHIGHNCDVGEDVVIAAQTGISGSSTVGRGAVIAGQVGIGDHAHVGPGVILGGQAGVLSGKKLEGAGQVLWGTPAKPLKQYLKELAAVGRLARKAGHRQ